MVDTSGTSTYAYDAANQLTGATYPNADTQAYTYDSMGNRTQKTHIKAALEAHVRNPSVLRVSGQTPAQYYGV